MDLSQTLSPSLSLSIFERVESGLVQDRGGPSEPAEQKMCAVLLELCQAAGGIQNLRQIHHTIQLNEVGTRWFLPSN